MKFIAHRGACLEVQEDTLEALEKASQYGAFAVECDPRYTADGVLVIFHDNDLARLAGNEKRVDKLTLAEMRDILSKAGKTLTTFDELLENYNGKAPILFDLSFNPENDAFFSDLAKRKANSIVGVHTPDEAVLALKHFNKKNILAFMKKPEDIDAYIDAGVGNIRLWEHWLDEYPIASVRERIPDDVEIWIMSRDKSIHHPLFCMNGSKEQIEKLENDGADAMLLNDIRLAWELRIKQ